MTLLRVENLSVAYPAFRLEPVSLRLAPGEIVAVVGESGSGKSTLARTVACLSDETAQVTGQVNLLGQDLSAMPEKARKGLRFTAFSLCFQNALTWLNPTLKLSGQLGEILIKKHPRKEHAALSQALMIRVGLSPEDLNQVPAALSGGMLQRFMLACAIALRPPLVILDEPTSALDPAGRAQLLLLLRQLNREEGTAFLIITHDIALARELASRTLVLYDGMVVEEGAADRVIETPHHPYTYGLMQSIIPLHPYRDLWGIRSPPAALSDLSGPRCRFYGRCTQSIDRCANSIPPLTKDPTGRWVACHRGGILKILSASGIVKQYGRKRVLDGAGIKVYAGEVVVILGPNGIGKSTLCGILSGYVAPDEGDVRFDGQPVDFEALRRQKGGLQLVMQDSDGALNPRFTVLEAVAEPLRLQGEGAAACRAIAVEKLEKVGLPCTEAFLAQPIATLSGGQKQRINLARALTLSPRLLIADEPTAQLDASTKANVLRMLKGVQHSEGCALLVVTHDRMAAQKIADRIYLLQDGKTQRLRDAEPPQTEQGEYKNG